MSIVENEKIMISLNSSFFWYSSVDMIVNELFVFTFNIDIIK